MAEKAGSVDNAAIACPRCGDADRSLSSTAMSHSAKPRVAEIVARYPCLEGLGPEEMAGCLEHEAQWLEVPAHSTVFREGDACRGFPLVMSGAIRVSRRSPAGRTVELYRVLPGEVCLFSANGMIAGGTMAATGEAVSASLVVSLAPATFERLTGHAPFRRFVFEVFGQRLAELITLVDSLAFQSLDQRLAGFLLGQGRVLQTTHQRIASELGTVREIVTRILNRFEDAGLLQLGRERIEILDSRGLRLVASSEGASGCP